MLRREITVSMNKKDKSEKPDEPVETLTFQQKTEVVVRGVERVATKLFVGVCIYILLDTYRKTSIESVKFEDLPDID